MLTAQGLYACIDAALPPLLVGAALFSLVGRWFGKKQGCAQCPLAAAGTAMAAPMAQNKLVQLKRR